MQHLQPGDQLWVKDIHERGTVLNAADTPRSYIIETSKGTLLRNRYHLTPTSGVPEESTNLPETAPETTTPDAVSTSVTPEVLREGSQQTLGCERRYPSRIRAPPAYLKDFVCS